MKNQFVAYSEFINPDCGWVVGIDAGHGGLINGTYDTAPDKMYNHGDLVFYEGVFNRSIALNLSGHLIEENISHYFTTDSNYDISLPIRTTRVNNFIRKYPDKKHIMLSTHGNAFSKDLSVRGIEVWTYSKNRKSDKYGGIINSNLRDMGWKMRGCKKGNFHMLRESKAFNVLVELGFYTNLEEAELMSKPKTQRKFSKLLFNGIKEITK